MIISQTPAHEMLSQHIHSSMCAVITSCVLGTPIKLTLGQYNNLLVSRLGVTMCKRYCVTYFK